MIRYGNIFTRASNKVEETRDPYLGDIVGSKYPYRRVRVEQRRAINVIVEIIGVVLYGTLAVTILVTTLIFAFKGVFK